MSPLSLRLVGYAFPPLGLVLLWRSSRTFTGKVIGTLGLGVYSLLYAGLIIFLLIRFAGLQIEWRGGYLPALTYSSTKPDYDALERHRSTQVKTSALDVPVSSGAYWTGFRGPKRDGIYEERAVATNWLAQAPPLLWREPVGGGYSSFAIAEGLAFTLEQRRDKEVVAAYAFATGREVWVCEWPGEHHDYYSEAGPRSTPSWSEGRVYALGALGTLSCVEAMTGKLLWSHEILAENHSNVPSYGVAASPVVLGDAVIVLAAAGHGHSVLCYDKKDGQLIRAALDDVTGYASPIVATLAGREQIIVCCETRTVGLSPRDGKVLWEYPWHVKNKQLPIAQPVLLGTNRFLLSAGYFTGCAAVEVSCVQSAFHAQTLWQNKNLKNKFNSSVFLDGHIYGLDEDILTCLDAATGERKWKEGRYGYGQIILSNGHLIILSGDGELALVKATPQRWRELARFQAITGKTWNHPALAEGKLLVRNAREMACFDLSSP